MILLDRKAKSQVQSRLVPNKVVVLLGPRRVGKTVLLDQIMAEIEEPYLLLSGEDFEVISMLENRSVQNYKRILGNVKFLIIDEAQEIPDIGAKLKLMVDHIEGIRILITGSSAFDIENSTGEPLTGRKNTLRLFALSEQELNQVENIIEKRSNLKNRLVFGNYPELIHLTGNKEKADYLSEIINSYLLKDILAFETIRNSDKIISLLRLVAFQVGGEVSLQELGGQLSMSKNTVEKYLDLLSKVFVIHRVGGFSRNLRKEVTKNSKWYFHDNGIRNLLTANVNPIETRDDVGQLWENYIISERLKVQSYDKMIVNNYFWRTYDQQEIDWVEDRGGKLYGYEFKWSPKKNVKIPVAWRKSYPSAEFQVINRENYLDWRIDQ